MGVWVFALVLGVSAPRAKDPCPDNAVLVPRLERRRQILAGVAGGLMGAGTVMIGLAVWPVPKIEARRNWGPNTTWAFTTPSIVLSAVGGAMLLGGAAALALGLPRLNREIEIRRTWVSLSPAGLRLRF